MRGFIFLFANLAVSSAFVLSAFGPNTTSMIDVGVGRDISEVNNNTGLFLDDILVPPTKPRSATNDPSRLWVSPIAYVLDQSLELNAKGVILKAINQFRLRSCIDFKPRDNESSYLSFVKLNGCFSYIGRVGNNRQNISIGSSCDARFIAEHEILHALGFYHEQSRYDRDDYVIIKFENILPGRENNFEIVPKNISTDNGVSYDFWSVMHYGKNAFTNGNGSTVITKDPKFQDVIGQQYGMSPKDLLELNRLYNCSSSISKNMFCDFSNGTMCQMTHYNDSGIGWEVVSSAPGSPSSDHTGLPTGNDTSHQGLGHFMHASTATGRAGDSALLETARTTPSGKCHVQCLQFYYYHSGNQTDQLNIWLREFQNESDRTGTDRLVKQITGVQTTHWQIVQTSLNTTKLYQVVFEVRKGNGTSGGGFSLDDINLSATECPQFTGQLNNFEKLLNDTVSGSYLNGPRLYSKGGYSYRFGITLYRTFFALHVQLLSGKYDDQLEWPCPRRQVTFQMLDQHPNLQAQMSKERSITSDLATFNNGSYLWDNPRKVGTPYQEEDNQISYEGPRIGILQFADLEEMKYLSFLKGGSAVFTYKFEDLTPLVNQGVLPCPKLDQGISTTSPPPVTTDDSIFSAAPGLMAPPVIALLLSLMCLML